MHPRSIGAILHAGSRYFGAGSWTKPEVESLVRRYSFVQRRYERFSIYARVLCLRPIADAILRYLPERRPVLDLGCGHGLTGHLLASLKHAAVWGIEQDRRRCEIARQSMAHHPDVEIVQGDLISNPWPKATSALLIDVLYQLPNTGKRSLLLKCAQALEKDGTLLIKDTSHYPGWKFTYTLLEERCKLAMGIYGPGGSREPHYVRADELHGMASEYGLRHVATEPIPSMTPYPGVIYIYRRS